MRCLALAQWLRHRGHLSTFACRELDHNIINVIEELQFKVTRYDASFTETQDAADVLATLVKERPDGVILDHYALGKTWETTMRSAGHRVLVVDDLFREHDCDALLDQNFHAGHAARWAGRVPMATKLFLGPAFALLHPSFFSHARPPVPREGARRLLVFFGGTDSHRASGMFLREWRERPVPGVEATLLVGGGHPLREEWRAAGTEAGLNVVVGSRDVAGLLAETDLYLGAGGSITWERAYFGVSGTVVAVAENQVELSRSLATHGYQEYLGEVQALPPGAMREAVARLVADRARRVSYGQACLGLAVGSRAPEVAEWLAGTG